MQRRSKRLRKVFLFEEIITISSAQITRSSLESLSSKLAAICVHKDLLNIKLETIPTVWRRMIDKAKKSLKVSIDELCQEYRRMGIKGDEETITDDLITLGGWESVIKKLRVGPRYQTLNPALPLKQEGTEAQKEMADRTDLREKMKSILSILSANNEIFWFRFALISVSSQSNTFKLPYKSCFL